MLVIKLLALPVPAHLQARAEDYSEAIAFVHLLNALWRGGSSGGTAPADEGRSVAHFTKFVRDDLLGTAFQVRSSGVGVWGGGVWGWGVGKSHVDEPQKHAWLLSGLVQHFSGALLETCNRQPAGVCLLLHAVLRHAHFLAPLQRAYKEERQRWLLVSACLEHCELCLGSLRSGKRGETVPESSHTMHAAMVRPRLQMTSNVEVRHARLPGIHNPSFVPVQWPPWPLMPHQQLQ